MIRTISRYLLSSLVCLLLPLKFKRPRAAVLVLVCSVISPSLFAWEEVQDTSYNPRDSDGCSSGTYEENREYLEKLTTEGWSRYDQCGAPGKEYKILPSSNPNPDAESCSTTYTMELYCRDYQEPEEPECPTDTISGGDIMGGQGSGVYDVEGCAYSCGTNYDLLDGGTSLYEARECSGLGQEFTSDDPEEYDDPPDSCSFRDSQGNCLDMADQDGGSCPDGSTYGQVDGVDVCVPSGSSADGLDEGSEGPEGGGGSEPDAGSDDGAGDDGSGDDGSGDDGSGDDGGSGGSGDDGSGDGDGSGEDDGSGDDGGSGGSGGDGEGEEDGSSFSDAGCDSPPTCEGDAVQCAIAEYEWKQSCEGENAADEVGEFMDGKTSGTGKLGDDDLVIGQNTEQDLTDTFTDWDKVDSGYSAECPDPRVLELAVGGTQEVKFDAFCEFADEINPFVIFMFTFLGSAAIGRTLIA